MRFTHGNSGDALRAMPDALFTPTGASLLVSFIVSLFSSLFDLSPFCLSENVVRRQTLLARLIFEVCPKPGCILL